MRSSLRLMTQSQKSHLVSQSTNQWSKLLDRLGQWFERQPMYRFAHVLHGEDGEDGPTRTDITRVIFGCICLA
ncbi:hypothetical protein BDP67DRAFT_123269 [Colletotrichum lupini]|nr:hypothetical protein BDP67DRAFT_123269 [Colletotrichum lupini]